MIVLHDRLEIEAYLRGNVYLNLYSLGDLDDFFWPHTVWYGLRVDSQIQALILVYTAVAIPTVIALADDSGPLALLLQETLHLLPGRFFTHFSAGLEPVAAPRFRLKPLGRHHKMALTNPARLAGVDQSAAVQLSAADLPAVRELYALSYPDNAFDPRMLETRCYYGVWAGPRLLSIAGIHVYSPRYRVAALGNVTTHPDYRGRGLSKAVTARLCQALSATVDHIGLNVKVDNRPALAVYRSLGFEVVADYHEFIAEAVH